MFVIDLIYFIIDWIFEYLNFLKCCEVYFDVVFNFYEFELFLIELMFDGGCIMVYVVVMVMWGGYWEDDLESFLFISCLKKMVDFFGVVSFC